MKTTDFRQVLKLIVTVAVLTLCSIPISRAQQVSPVVPPLVKFSGLLMDANHKPLTGTVGVTFALYSSEQGGSPLWLETQNVKPDNTGQYTVMLGSSTSHGLPAELFASGEARWLGVQAQGQAEQPRVLLISVPYALKAGDAETVGGLPASAFLLAMPPTGNSPTEPVAQLNTRSGNPDLGGTGTTDFIPLWTSSTQLGNSALFQGGTPTKPKIGIGTTTPAATLDVKGSGTVRGLLSLPASGTATASKGKNSQAFDLAASAFNSGTSTAVPQTFQWQAEPVGNNTSTATGSLNLLFGQGTNKVSETGLNIASDGQITFATGQTFPGTGTISGVTAGTDLTGGGTSGNVTLNVDTTKVVTGVTAGTDLTGGGTGGSLTLNLDTTKVPQLSANNSFTGNQSITGNLTATGSITGQTASFSANNTTQVVSVTQSGTGSGLVATMPSAAAAYTPAILGNATNTSGYGVGVQGLTAAQNGIGMYGQATNSTLYSYGYGVYGETNTYSGAGVQGSAGSTANDAYSAGVSGISDAPNGVGVVGNEAGSNGIGVQGYTSGSNGIGVQGYTSGSSGIGIYGIWNGASAIGTGITEIGVWGDSSTGFGILGTSDSSIAVFGASTSSAGVSGFSSSSYGVYGQSSFDGVYGQSTGSAYGVVGGSEGGVGVDGVEIDRSVTGSGFSNIGAWGDSKANDSIGVLGTTDDGNSLFGKNNTANHETLYTENDSSTVGARAVRFAGPGAGTYCYVVRDSSGFGDLVCTGSKSAAVPVEGNRMVRLYAVEAADNWFEDAGSGELANGSAVIALDQIFAQTVNGDLDYHVFITPNGECEGLYVAHKSAQGFEVHELHGGHSNIAFDYRIMARRKGFENVRMQDVTEDFAQMKQESDLLSARIEARKQEEKAHPKMEMPTLPKRVPSSRPHLMRTPTLPLAANRVIKPGK
jgi:hypothetical protein